MSNSTASHLSISQPRSCPLAFDETGKPISIPPEAAFWRVRRHTAGRPRVVVGADRQPLKLPLDYTADELLYLVGRGAYRLDLCDETGESLETVAITIGEPEPELRNAAAGEDPGAISPMLPTTGNEVRLVLEANVRATQMAFHHNERTLAASLKMAETLRDGVHVLAESQADWIKSLANARGLFRNAAPPPTPPEPPKEDDDDDDDNDTGNTQLYAFGVEVMKLVNGLVGSRTTSAGESEKKLLKSGTGFDWRTLLDWRRAAPVAEGEAQAKRKMPPAISAAEMLRVYASLPDELKAKLDEVRARLSPQEQAQLMSTFALLDADHIAAIATELAPLSADEIVARIRKQLGTEGKE